MRLLLSMAIALLVLSSCSENEVLNGGNDFLNDGKIRFSAASGKTNTRAATGNPIAKTVDLETLGLFKATGYVVGTTTPLLPLNTEVSYKGISWEYTVEPYWPSSDMDFLAHANWATAPAVANTGITATTVTIAEDVIGTTGQKDLLVAIETDKKKETRTTLNFKHALTQIVFKAGNIDSDNLEVRIGGLRIVNVNTTGDMDYVIPTGNRPLTDKASIIWKNQTTPVLGAGKGSYHLQDLQTLNATDFDKADVAASAAYTVTKPDDEAKYSTYDRIENTPAATPRVVDNAFMLIPQTFGAWTPAADKTTGAYIEVLAIINAKGKMSTETAIGDANYYYAGKPVQSAAGAANGSSDTYGKIYIPVQSVTGEAGEWTPGKRITYIITFGDRNSGSGGGGYDDKGDPVLVPIRFNAVVEDWTDVDVPLLTVSFEANSEKVNAGFINGFTQQLLFDIMNAKENKLYNASVTISGKIDTETTAATTFVFDPSNYPTAGNSIDAKFVANSTVTYNFSKIASTDWATKELSAVVPTGWGAKSYKDTDRTTAISTVDAAGTISVNGTTANVIVFTKK